MNAVEYKQANLQVKNHLLNRAYKTQETGGRTGERSRIPHTKPQRRSNNSTKQERFNQSALIFFEIAYMARIQQVSRAQILQMDKDQR